VSVASLHLWVKAVREQGAKGLEHPAGEGRRGGRPIAPAVAAEVVATKRAFPYFGLRRVRDYVGRFLGLRVTTHTVARATRAAGLPPTEVPRRRRRGPNRVKRFERARAGQLWQSDITSFLLTRSKQRVYLIAFVDDHSRYVVAWGLHVRQKQEIAIEALLEGIARFGKPKEVLTDQGRQYVSWRGKSDFTKVLDREGIRHVVARSHHPQTLGKCERLWGSVKREFWNRLHPQDLVDARERLSHYFAHYNHFRPHQGIGGLVPADRFFGAAEAVRRAIEKSISRNELRLALGERPRRPVYLAGQVDGQAVSVTGERGRLVIRTPGGGESVLGLDELGTGAAAAPEDSATQSERAGSPRIHAAEGTRPGTAPEPSLGTTDTNSEGDDDDEHGDDGDDGGGRDLAADEDVPQAAAGREGAAAGLPDAGALGLGDRGGAREGACDVRDDPGVLARREQQGGGVEEARRAAAARVADEPARGRGDGVRAAAPAADEEEGRHADEPRGGPEGAPQADREARARDRVEERADPDPEGPAGEQGPQAPAASEGARSGGAVAAAAGSAEGAGEPWDPADEEEAHPAHPPCERRWERGSGPGLLNEADARTSHDSSRSA